jgi:carbon storage regulator CsrA
MLVLSRKPQEQILLPGLDVRITVLSIGPGRVQLGIEAPRAIQVTRPDARRPAHSDDVQFHAAFPGKPR